MKHYKFKFLMLAARLGLTAPLHFSIWKNLGAAMFFIGLLLLMGSEDRPDSQMQISVALMIVGLVMGGAILMKLFENPE